MSLRTTLFICFILLTSVTTSQVIYVIEGGTGDGSSWGQASGNLSGVLNNAPLGSEIWVAGGTYYPVTCSPCTDDDRGQYFEIKDGISLYGGFNGTEGTLDQRDWQMNLTVLSGDIDQDGSHDQNSQTVVYTRHVTAATIIDGFKISDGYADLSAAALGHIKNSGAGWFNDGQLNGFSSHPVIRNCVFSNNIAVGFGGGMYNEAGFSGAVSPVYENCTFSGNSAAFGGGGIYNQANFSGTCNALFENCVFTGNQSDADGGGVFNQGAESGFCNPEFNNCIFSGNISGVSGGGIVNVGRKGNCSPVFSNCLFDGNHSENGGGMYNDASFEGLCQTQVNNCTFKNNTSDNDGGGLFNLGAESGICNIALTNCVFENNHSGFAGGGVFNNGVAGESNPVITNCKFLSNIADTYGGGIYNLGKNGNSSPVLTNCLFVNNVGSSAGAIYNLGSDYGNSSPTITNCTFYGNTANVGGAVYNNANDSTGTSSPVITNTIFWNNQSDFGAVFRNILGAPYIRYSIVDQPDCFSLNNGIDSDVSCGAGMIYDQYPMFEDTLAGDFRLQEGSPAIDMGHNPAIDSTGIATDLNHQARIYNAIVDLGAYENSGTYFPPQITQQPLSLSLCEGETAVFEITVSGTPPVSYQWLFDGAEIAGADESSYLLSESEFSDAGNYSCLVISQEGDTLASEVAFLEVDPLLTPLIDIVSSTSVACEGDQVEFVAFTEHGGNAASYQWMVDGVDVGTDSFYFSTSGLYDGALVHCRLTSSETCLTENEINSDTIVISINEWVESAVSIEASSLEICEGESVEVIAFPVNGGDDPQFEWLLNGAVLSASGAEINLETLEHEAVLSVFLTSSEACAVQNPVSSDALTFTVYPVIEAGIEIEASALVVCQGEEITFDASFANGGNSPVFQWLLNGNNTGNDNPQYTASDFTDGDVIQCVMNSSENCVINNPVTSNDLQIAVNDKLEASISISGPDTTLCIGSDAVFSTSIENGGQDPQFDWQLNGSSLSINEPEWIVNSLNDGDEVLCILTSSEACLVENPVVSNSIIVSVDSCLNVGVSEQLAQNFVELYPNPSNGNFFLRFDKNMGLFDLEIMDVQGKTIFTTRIDSDASLEHFIQTEGLPQGIYFAKIHNNALAFLARIAIH